MRVVLTPEAAEQLESRKRWWRRNRTSTADLLEQEFLDALALIRERPLLFAVAMTIEGRQIRRVLMEKTSCHLYYEVDSAEGRVTILAAAGASQRRTPKMHDAPP
jgi:plasmid stabilization system protein ParE